jgi:APA family basic amino acid/polyamine antiporter
LIKLAILLFFTIVAFTGFNAANFTPFFNSGTTHGMSGMSGVAAGAAVVFFSFIGLDTVATAGEEVRDPTRNVPRGILAALGIVTVFYLLVAVAAVGAQPAALFKGQAAGLAVILQNVTGMAWPGLVLSAGAVISVFSVTLVTIYGQTRILYAISRDGLIPQAFQKVNPRTQAPVNNTLIVGAVVGLVSALVHSDFLWDMVSMGTLTAFMAVAIAVPVLRRREGEDIVKGFRVPLGPYLVPGLSIAACLYLMSELSLTTYKMFGVVMGLALATYFLYSIRHSKLNQD